MLDFMHGLDHSPGWGAYLSCQCLAARALRPMVGRGDTRWPSSGLTFDEPGRDVFDGGRDDMSLPLSFFPAAAAAVPVPCSLHVDDRDDDDEVRV